MHKLVIMVESLPDREAFFQAWPQFLHLAETMPGLLRESTSEVDRVIFGDMRVFWIHELYFESPLQLTQAMESPQGREAGKLLQQMTQGRVILFFANHSEDLVENFRVESQQSESS